MVRITIILTFPTYLLRNSFFTRTALFDGFGIPCIAMNGNCWRFGVMAVRPFCIWIWREGCEGRHGYLWAWRFYLFKVKARNWLGKRKEGGLNDSVIGVERNEGVGVERGVLLEGVGAKYEEILARELGIPGNRRPYFLKWLGEFLEFCRVRHLGEGNGAGLDVFLEGLRKRGRLGFQVEQARIAVEVYWKHFRVGKRGGVGLERVAVVAPVGAGWKDKRVSGSGADASVTGSSGVPGWDAEKTPVIVGMGVTESLNDEPGSKVDATGDWRMAFAALAKEIKLRHYSGRTLKAYLHWVRDFSRYVGGLPVAGLTSAQAKAYIADLATVKKVAGSTQNQAFSALLFFYSHVLGLDLQGLEKIPRAVRRQEIPSVLTRSEVQAMLAGLEYPYKLFVQLLYGCGLRLNESLTLRVQDVDLEGSALRVHNGKGNKSRALPLPKSLLPQLRDHLQSLRGLFESDLKVGFAGVFLPEALERKYPGASRSWPWQWVFPGGRLSVSESDGRLRRFHLHESSVQKEIKAAADAGRLSKRVTAHTFRHSYATHLLQMGYDIRVVQDLMGHNDLETTMIYTHVLQSLAGRVVSPLDV